MLEFLVRRIYVACRNFPSDFQIFYSPTSVRASKLLSPKDECGPIRILQCSGHQNGGLYLRPGVHYRWDARKGRRMRSVLSGNYEKASPLELLLSSKKHSFIPGLCGVLAGLSYQLNVFGIRRIKFPELVASTAARVLSPFLSTGPSTAASRRNITREIVDAPMGRQFQGGFAASAPPLAPSVTPSEEAISTLVSMGFDRNASVQALVQSRNDIIAAANLLLEAQSH